MNMILLFLMIHILKLDMFIALIVRKKCSKSYLFLNYLGYIKFDFVCDLNSLENELFQKSSLLYLDYCTFHALGLYDNNNSYIVQKVYICSDLITSFMVP
jgi:hypothetical protein